MLQQGGIELPNYVGLFSPRYGLHTSYRLYHYIFFQFYRLISVSVALSSHI